MILPRGKAIYENLNTSFTNFVELLSDLKKNHITGVVSIVFWEYEGLLFLDSGNIINAIEQYEGNRKIGQDAVNRLVTKVKEKDGTISVYGFSSDLIAMLVSTLQSEIVYKELSSDFTNLEKLLEKLKSEQHTGYIEILTNDYQHLATIFIQGGEPIESIISNDNNAFAKTDFHDKIHELAKSKGVMFNIYRAGFGTENEALITKADALDLLDFWGRVISIIERRIDPNAFERTFYDILIEKADDYPFLDPFAAEFKYANGKIEFAGNITKDFITGLSECIQATLQKIPVPEFKSELESLIKTNSDVISKYSLEKIVNQLLM
ncbi:hypothetical protein JXJ21_24140 [candidate division KSB1 bacterium]|nr:hypothetical protein [candidate division KSB1 bacterium]